MGRVLFFFFYFISFLMGFFLRRCLLDGRVNWSERSVRVDGMRLVRLVDVEESLEFGD